MEKGLAPGDTAIWRGVLHPSKEQEFHIVTLLESGSSGWLVETEDGLRAFALMEDLMVPMDEGDENATN